MMISAKTTVKSFGNYVDQLAIEGGAARKWIEKQLRGSSIGSSISDRTPALNDCETPAHRPPEVKQRQKRRLNNRWKWDKIEEQITARIDKKGIPGKTDDPSWTRAKIANEIQSWCILDNELGEAPTLSQIHEHISRCLQQPKYRSA